MGRLVEGVALEPSSQRATATGLERYRNGGLANNDLDRPLLRQPVVFPTPSVAPTIEDQYGASPGGVNTVRFAVRYGIPRRLALRHGTFRSCILT